VTDGALLGVNVAGNPTEMLFYTYADCIGTPLVRRTGLMPVLQVIGDTVFGPAGTSGATTAASVGRRWGRADSRTRRPSPP
jgi:hypothetical protein